MTQRPRRGPCCWIVTLVLITVPVHVFGDTILLTFSSVPGGVPVTGAGTDIGILDYGTVSAFEPLTAGVNRTVGASDYTISTLFGVRVVRVLGTTATYTLQARLLTAQPITWRMDGVTITTTPAVVSTAQPYGSILAHTLGLVIPFSQPSGAVNATFEVTAVAN